MLVLFELYIATLVINIQRNMFYFENELVKIVMPFLQSHSDTMIY